MVKYYYAGSQRIAMWIGSGTTNPNLQWLVGNHASIKLSTSLGSTSVTADYAGTLISRTLYKPWGGRKRRASLRRCRVRYQSGALPTQYTFTGQYSHTADFGLMFYVATWRAGMILILTASSNPIVLYQTKIIQWPGTDTPIPTTIR